MENSVLEKIYVQAAFHLFNDNSLTFHAALVQAEQMYIDLQELIIIAQTNGKGVG